MENENRGRRCLHWLCWPVLATMIVPSPAWAFIPHWDPLESFFIRQFAYFFWALAMVFFIIALKQENLHQHKGFRWLVWSGIFFALWNINCFFGQFIALAIFPREAAALAGTQAGDSLAVSKWLWLFYFTKLDHLLLVPALVCFYFGIRAFNHDAEVKL